MKNGTAERGEMEDGTKQSRTRTGCACQADGDMQASAGLQSLHDDLRTVMRFCMVLLCAIIVRALQVQCSAVTSTSNVWCLRDYDVIGHPPFVNG